MGSLFHLVWWKRTKYMAAKSLVPRNRVNPAKALFQRLTLKSPVGRGEMAVP